MTTRADMVNAGKEAVRLKVQYIYGAKPAAKGRFRVYSLAEIRQFRDWYGSDCVWWEDDSKAGQLCCDCSGLITFATGREVGSWQLENEALESVSVDTIKANWDKYIGWVLWMKGHVGIVSDRYGYYYAMDGSSRNAVHLPLSYNKFVKALRIPGVDYSPPAPPKIYGYSTKLYQSNNTPMQQYIIEDAGNGFVRIKSVGRGMYLDVRDGLSADRTPVRIWERTIGDAQLWKLIPVNGKYSRMYKLEPKCAPGKRLDAVSGGTVNKTGLQIYHDNGTAAQLWIFIDSLDGKFRIANAKSGLVIDCGDGVQP